MCAFEAAFLTFRLGRIATAAMLIAMVGGLAEPAPAQPLTPHQRLAFDIFKELVEINTVSDTGDTARAADAMAARLRSARFTASEVQVFKPAPRKGNLVARALRCWRPKTNLTACAS